VANEVRVEGLAALDRMLKELPAKIEGNVMRGALRAGQTVIADAARENLVAAGAVKSGALVRSVKVRFKRRSAKFGWIRVDVVAGDKTAWYAHIIEFGSGGYYTGTGSKSKRRAYSIKPSKAGALSLGSGLREGVTHPGVRPRRFMRDALDRKSQAAIDRVAEYLRVRVPREVAKMPGGKA